MAKQEKKEFDFINEQIKTRPFYKKKWFYRMMMGFACAILFGGVAGVTFAIVKPWAEKQFGDPGPQTQIVILPEESETSESLGLSALPETEEMSGSKGMSKTEEMSGSKGMSETEEMSGSNGMPETEEVSGIEASSQSGSGQKSSGEVSGTSPSDGAASGNGLSDEPSSGKDLTEAKETNGGKQKSAEDLAGSESQAEGWKTSGSQSEKPDNREPQTERDAKKTPGQTGTESGDRKPSEAGEKKTVPGETGTKSQSETQKQDGTEEQSETGSREVSSQGSGSSESEKTGGVTGEKEDGKAGTGEPEATGSGKAGAGEPEATGNGKAGAAEPEATGNGEAGAAEPEATGNGEDKFKPGVSEETEKQGAGTAVDKTAGSEDFENETAGNENVEIDGVDQTCQTGQTEELKQQDQEDLSEQDNSTDEREAGDAQDGTVQNGLDISDYKQLYGELSEVANSASKSVVTVTGLKENANFFDDVYGSNTQSSGLIVASTGLNIYILTESRVIDGMEKILITFPNGASAEAFLQKKDQKTGLAIVRVAYSDLPAEARSCFELADLGNSQNIRQGDPVIAVGSPLGYSNSMAFGMVTSVTEVPSADCCYHVITTDMIGSQAGSGIILNLDGKVIGIISQDFNKESEQITVSGIGISDLKWLIETLSNNVDIPYLGIVGKEVTDSVAQELDMPKGLYIKSVEPDSPAMYSGLQTADIIVRIQDTEIVDMDSYVELARSCSPEDALKITVMRQGPDGYVEITRDITVGAR